jgi:hypothetical protein
MPNQAPTQVKSRLESTGIRAAGAAIMLIAMAAIPAAAAGSPSASPQCAPRPEFLKQLSKRFHEEPVALGLTNNGSVIEVLTSDDGSTWTMMISRPNGSSCLIAAGEGWEQGKRVVKGERGA